MEFSHQRGTKALKPYYLFLITTSTMQLAQSQSIPPSASVEVTRQVAEGPPTDLETVVESEVK